MINVQFGGDYFVIFYMCEEQKADCNHYHVERMGKMCLVKSKVDLGCHFFDGEQS